MSKPHFSPILRTFSANDWNQSERRHFPRIHNSNAEILRKIAQHHINMKSSDNIRSRAVRGQGEAEAENVIG